LRVSDEPEPKRTAGDSDREEPPKRYLNFKAPLLVFGERTCMGIPVESKYLVSVIHMAPRISRRFFQQVIASDKEGRMAMFIANI
jgi:hypothetical protein